jgi:hypothetical protein
MPFLKVFSHTKVAHVLENNVEVLKLKKCEISLKFSLKISLQISLKYEEFEELLCSKNFVRMPDDGSV